MSFFSLFHNRSTALGSAICAGAAVKLFGWDLKNPASLKEVNTKGSRELYPICKKRNERRSGKDGRRLLSDPGNGRKALQLEVYHIYHLQTSLKLGLQVRGTHQVY